MSARPIALLFVLAALCGCGTAPTTSATESLVTASTSIAPSAVPSPMLTPTPQATQAPAGIQYGTTPDAIVTSSPGNASMPDLTARITTSHKAFLSLGKFSCTVEVVNAAAVYRTGTLTINFLNGTKASKTAPIVKKVSLGPQSTQSLTFTETRWFTSSATVSITSDPGEAAPIIALDPGTTSTPIPASTDATLN
jgi:hypothetical protein